MPTKEAPSRRFYLTLSAYCLGQAVVWGGLTVIGVPSRVEQLVARDRLGIAVGAIAGLGALAAGLGLILIGALSDRWRGSSGRRRPFVLAGALLALPGFWGYATTTTFLGLLLSVTWLQIAVAVATGPYHALIPDLVPQDRLGEASAYQGVAQLLGSAAGPLLAGVLLASAAASQANRGPSTLAAILGGTLVVTAVVTYLGVRERPAQEWPPPKALLETMSFDFRKYPSFGWLIVSRFFITMGFVTALGFLLYYVQFTFANSHARALTLTTEMQVLATVAGLVGTFPAGREADRSSKKRVIYISAGLCLAAGLCFAVSPIFPLAFLSALVFGLGWGAFAAVDWSLACELVPEEETARYMGAWGFSLTLPGVLGPLLAGPLADLVNAAAPGWAGPGPGYRLVMLLSVLYFTAGVLAVRHIREARETAAAGTPPKS
ncbi:MAG TPA: MFS transporter [Armatimonadota bacterium]